MRADVTSGGGTVTPERARRLDDDDAPLTEREHALVRALTSAIVRSLRAATRQPDADTVKNCESRPDDANEKVDGRHRGFTPQRRPSMTAS